jgi:hypothetical protein
MKPVPNVNRDRDGNERGNLTIGNPDTLIIVPSIMRLSYENRSNSVMADPDPIIISLSYLFPCFSFFPLPLRERIKERGSINSKSPSFLNQVQGRLYLSPVKEEGKKKRRERETKGIIPAK